MKQLMFFILLCLPGILIHAQRLDTILIVQKAKKIKPRKHILLMFELLDSLDRNGRKTSITRSYYFDKKQRLISTVREFYNPKRPDKGRQVVYTFSRNRLATVTVTPPKSECRNCTSEYHYSGGTLLTKNEKAHTHANSQYFIEQSRYFLSKLPTHLPWGHFEDEVIVKGRMRKSRRQY
jgi:hypothetical protein